jgi:peptide/nickel transport system substrate-binding protein
MKKRMSLLLVVLMLLLIPLAGCQGSGTETTAAATTTAGGTEAATEAASTEPSVLRIGTTSEPDSTSPLIATLSAYSIIANVVYNDLIEYDDNLNPVGGLAESWSVSDDGLTWTYNLRQGVKWFDGEDFTADDVVWTYTTLLAGEFPQSVQLTGITAVTKVDDYTVEMTTEAPKADMESVRVGILPEHIYKDKSIDDLYTFAEETPVGTGIYKLTEWEPGQYLKFEANKDYFGGTPQVDEVIYVIFANTDTLMQALTTGEVDAVTSVASNQVETLAAEDGIEVVQAAGRNWTQLGFNCWDSPDSLGNPLVLDPQIRLACDYAIDKQQIVDLALNGYGIAATSMIPASVGDWHWDPGSEIHNYDPETAKQILEDAGYTDTNGDGIREDANGNPLDFRFAVISSYGEAYIKASAVIQKNLQEIGINTTITTMDGGAQSDLIYEQNFDTDMYLWGWGAELDPSLKLSVMLTDQIGKRSDCFWSNSEYDALYDLQVTQVNRDERINTVHEMQKIVYEEAPYIILYNKDTIEAYRTDKFEGWTKVPSEIGSTISQVNKSLFLSLKPIQ